MSLLEVELAVLRVLSKNNLGMPWQPRQKTISIASYKLGAREWTQILKELESRGLVKANRVVTLQGEELRTGQKTIKAYWITNEGVRILKELNHA